MRQIELLQFALEALDRQQIPYAIVGSYASGVWGEPRMTLDIDITVLMRESDVEPFAECFPEDEFYLSRQAVLEAVRTAGQFNVIHPTSGNKVDLMVLTLAGETPREIARRRLVEILPGVEAYFASPEDVILAKLRYCAIGGSEKHLRDIAGVIRRSGQVLDFAYLAEGAAGLGAAQLWHDVLRQLGYS